MYIFSLHSLACRSTCVEKGKERRERERKSFMITKNNLCLSLTLLSPDQTYRDTPSRLYARAIRFFFLLNICKTIIAQANRQTAKTSSPIGGIEKRGGEKEEKKRERERRRTRSISDYIIDY
jgi:hypothetical protein